MVKKKSDKDEEEIEEVSEERKGEFSEEVINEVVEDGENFNEVSDFFIGDIGLTTANIEDSWKGANLEKSLDEEPLNKWEEQHEEPSEEKIYNGSDEREDKGYSEVERGSNIYMDDGRVRDIYSAESGGSGEFYDPRIGKVADKEEVRSVGLSKLEIVGLQKGFGRGTEKELRDKIKDRKYHG